MQGSQTESHLGPLTVVGRASRDCTRSSRRRIIHARWPRRRWRARVRSQVDSAYRRIDLFEGQHQLMDEWTAYPASENRDPGAGPIR